MKKYFKKDSNIEVNFGDNVAFVKQGEYNGLQMYNKVEGEITPDNVGDLVELGFIDEKVVPTEPANKPCGCDYDIDKIENPLKELGITLAKLEKVVEILGKLVNE